MKGLGLWIFACLLNLGSLAQTDSTKTDSAAARTSITLGAVYSSNANYYGQTTEEKLPYVLSSASVRFPGGFWISGGAYKLLNYEEPSAVSAGALGAGFDFSISKRIGASLGYTRSFFPANSPMLQAANLNTASGSLTFDWTWFTSSVSSDYAFGQQSDVFLSVNNSKLIDLGSLFSEADYLSLEPSVEIVGGTQRFYQTYTTTQKKRKRDKIFDRIKNPFSPPQEEETTTTTTVMSTSFDLLSYNLRLPLAYNRAHYMIEGSYQLSILGKKVESTTSRPQSFFNLSFYYLF